MSSPKIEVLVHIAAPSKASDDAKYLDLAQAYLDFEPAARHPIASTPEEHADSGFRQPGSSIGLSALSFESVWDNVGSPAVRQPRPVSPDRQSRRRQHRVSYVSPTAVIPDSQPESKAFAARQSSSRMSLRGSFCDGSLIAESQENTQSTQSSDAACALLKEAPSPDLSMLEKGSRLPSLSQEESSVPRSPLSQRSANSQQLPQQWDGAFTQADLLPVDWDSIIPSSDLPNVPMENPPTSPTPDNIPSSLPEESGKVVLLEEQARHTNATDASTADQHASEQPARELKHAQTKRRRQLHDNGRPMARSVSDAGPATKKRRTTTLVPSESLPATVSAGRRTKEPVAVADRDAAHDRTDAVLRLLPSSPADGTGTAHDDDLCILSPEPPVACDLFVDAASVVTDKLAKLALDLNLARRYRPSGPPARALRPFERGFWRLSTAGWPAELRRQAWAFLAEYVGHGDAGWGVWCSRDRAPHTWLRLHCFAAVAGHTYLLLYLASQRRILATGAVWLDGSGTPTITVAPRKNRRLGL